jgi:hypothetical protein
MAWRLLEAITATVLIGVAPWPGPFIKRVVPADVVHHLSFAAVPLAAAGRP